MLQLWKKESYNEKMQEIKINLSIQYLKKISR